MMIRRTSTLLILQLSLLLVVGSTAPSVRAMRTTSSTTNSSNTTESPSPTISPFPTISPQPTPSNSSSSDVPTTSPGNSTVSPAPSIPPSVIPTTPSLAPTTVAPTKAPTSLPTTMTPTHGPTLAPVTSAPTQAPTPHHPPKKQHPSLLRILGKTIAWLFIIALALLAFGFLMSNRYRIYYYIRSAWYRFLQLPCTLWVLRKTGLNRLLWQQDNLNEIIFDNDLNEGLLLQDT